MRFTHGATTMLRRILLCSPLRCGLFTRTEACEVRGLSGALLMLAFLVVAGCGSPTARFDASQTPRMLGPGSAYRPAIRSHSGACAPTRGARYGVHLELFARGRVVLIPAGIGISPPLKQQGPYVPAGGCYAAAITREPTGVIEINASRRSTPPTLGELFALWGQSLAPTRLASFAHGHVSGFVNGARVNGPAASIRLTPHAEIVLEFGAPVPPHRRYRFPRGL